MPNYGDIKEISMADARQLILDLWAGMDLPSDLVFEDGSYPSMVLEAAAAIINKGTAYAEVMKTFTLSERATGQALTLYSKAVYNHSRNQATSAVFLLSLTCGEDVGPFTISEGDLVATEGSFTYRTTYKGLGGATFPCTINPGASVLVEFEAERPGMDPGSVSEASINRLVTTMVGVTCVGTELVRAGSNEETDAQLRQRNSTIWATRNPLTMTRDAYIYLARKASPNVKRVELDATNPSGEFSIAVYIAGDFGTSPPEDITAVETALRNRSYAPIKNRIRVYSATARPIPLAGIVYYYSGYDESLVRAAIRSSVNALIAEIPIGGSVFLGLGMGVLRSQFEKAILEAKIADLSAVKLVVLTSPAECTYLHIFEAATVDASFLDNLVFHGVE